MKDIYLVNYSVRGIKTLDQLVSLSFYKKTFSQELNTQEYNIKGIYGTNGSGKSGIVTSIDILKNLLLNPGYLSNPMVQKNLDAMINKRTGELFIEADYIASSTSPVMFFRYSVDLSKDAVGKYTISHEKLSVKNATSKSDFMMPVFEVVNGEVVHNQEDKDKFTQELLKKTTNLLSTNSMCVLFFEKMLAPSQNLFEGETSTLFASLCLLFIFASKLHICIEESDDHRNHIVNNVYECLRSGDSEIDNLRKSFVEMDRFHLDAISVTENIVSKEKYEYFEKCVDKLSEFIHIFKSDLQRIEIDKKENCDVYVCDLIMVYDSYKIHAEFESTGIKKLVKLYAYLKKMVEGEIVFIDELDSNLHDVYLCALLEYLMEYGKGQLCFTTHNVGPMDILKQHKKSIDFLSVDHKIYSWTKNGNYSPSKLYRNGMIEGSPFNIDSIDFIGVFGSGEEDA